MLEVQKYLRNYIHDIVVEAALETFGNLMDDEALTYIALDALTAEYGIKFNVWEEKLIVLNYSQIDSPKFHDITKECRSLVLNFKTLEVVSRSFDRFFNHTEDVRIKNADITTLTAYEKVDGSLIGLFNFEGVWLYRTKSMIMPDSIINNNVEGVTWKQRIEEALPSQKMMLRNLNPNWTTILELTCKENRVVTKYECETGLLTCLASRDNLTGVYNTCPATDPVFYKVTGFRSPKVYSFSTFEECAQAAKDLRNLEEGYVLYDWTGTPVIKLKNPAYVAAHHLRGEGCLTEKRILDLIVMNETDEYLSIFPEDLAAFMPYLDANSVLELKLGCLEGAVTFWKGLSKAMTQKEFAMEVKDKPYSSIAFGLWRGKTIKECVERLTRNSHHSMILAYKVT